MQYISSEKPANMPVHGRGGNGTYAEIKALVDCLMVLWEEIDKHYGQQDICIPILGSGITRMDDSALMQQELLDVIISTYKLSASKIKKPNKLIIACKRAEDFSLYKIGEYI